MYRMTMRHERGKVRRGWGFSLLEILIAISVIAILASLLVSSFRGMEAVSNTEVCKHHMRVTYRAFMDLKAEIGRIHRELPRNARHADELSRAAANTSSAFSSWGHQLIPEYMDWMPGPGLREDGLNLRRRLPYCPEYVGDRVAGGGQFGHGIPRTLLVYGMFIDNIPEHTHGIGNNWVQGPPLDRLLFMGDQYYPVYTSTTNLRGTFAGTAWRMQQGIQHGRNRDSMNFLMANGRAVTLRTLTPDNPREGFAGYFVRGFTNNPERIVMLVNNNAQTRSLLPLEMEIPE